MKQKSKQLHWSYLLLICLTTFLILDIIYHKTPAKPAEYNFQYRVKAIYYMTEHSQGVFYSDKYYRAKAR